MREVKGPRSIYKLMSIAALIIPILNIKQCFCEESIRIIRYCMFHKFPKVRKTLVDAFYLLMLADGDSILNEESNTQLCDILIENNWLEITDQQIDSLKNTFNSLIQV